MGSELSKAAAPTAVGQVFDREQVELLKRTVCNGATDDEFGLFMAVCKRTGLDPFSRQIHAVKRWSAKEKREVMSIQTGIDGLRLVAQRSGVYGGSDDIVYDIEDEPNPGKATCTVYKIVGGQRIPIATKSARWEEYAQTKKDGSLIPMWARMPYLMLGKCAEALALRAAFPAEMSGLYTSDEMGAEPAPVPVREIVPMEPGEFDALLGFLRKTKTPADAHAEAERYAEAEGRTAEYDELYRREYKTHIEELKESSQ